MAQSPSIEPTPNGPFIVRNVTKLRNSKGEEIPTEPVMALCRCGGSASKPFCDATHKKNGFSGARLSDASKDKQVTYQGVAIAIHDNRAICSHAGYCTDGLPAVFREEGSPWIDPDASDVEKVIETIRKCPSGALSYSLSTGPQPVEVREPAITITKDGPYAVVGGVALANAQWGEGASREHYTLCRCGASKNKPFCDGSHWDSGFKDAEN